MVFDGFHGGLKGFEIGLTTIQEFLVSFLVELLVLFVSCCSWCWWSLFGMFEEVDSLGYGAPGDPFLKIRAYDIYGIYGR